MKLGGREIELSGALPLRIKDWKALKTKGVSLESLRKGEADVDSMAALAAYVLEKAHAGDGALVDELTLPELTRILNSITEAEASEVDRPT